MYSTLFHGRQFELLVAARTLNFAKEQTNEENFLKWQPVAAGLQKDALNNLPFLPAVVARARPIQVLRVPLVFNESEREEKEASLSAMLNSYQRDYTQYLDLQLQAHVIDTGAAPIRRRRMENETKSLHK